MAPPKEVVACCGPRLRKELAGKDTIVLLGNTAKEAVLGIRTAITKVRQGPPRQHPDFPDASIIATVHPAACLRSSDSFPDLVADIRKVAGQGIFVKWEPPKYTVVDDEDTGLAAIEQLQVRRGPLAVDIEVGVDKDTSYTHPDQLLCVGLGYDENKAVVVGERALTSQAVTDRLGALLSTRDTTYQNGKYDEQVLMRLEILDEPHISFDTMLASYVLDERPGRHGLEGMASEHLGAPSWKGELDKHKRPKDSYAVIPRPVLYRYNAWDVSQTYNLQPYFEQRLREQGLRHVHDRLVGYGKELVYLELDGLGVDLDYNDTLDEMYNIRIDDLRRRLKPAIDNPNSPQQVMKVLKGMSIPATDTTADTLQRLFDRSQSGTNRHLFLKLMLIHRKLAKLHGTYIKGTRKRVLDGRVYPTYLLHGTVSGRLACRNPNVQNVPRGAEMRKQYVPREGYVFVQGDYKQAELRVAGCESRDEYLQEVFSDPLRDLFTEVAVKLYGDSYQKEQRVRVKAFVYGAGYGREAGSVANEFGISMREADDLIRGYFALVPQLVKWRQEIKNHIFKSGQALQTSFGRKRRFWLITKQNRIDVEKEGLSFIPQSTANDICLSALRPLREAFGRGATSPRLRIPVHDSLCAEALLEDRREVAQIMATEMQRAAVEQYSDFIPFPVDISTGTNWGELEDYEWESASVA